MAMNPYQLPPARLGQQTAPQAPPAPLSMGGPQPTGPAAPGAAPGTGARTPYQIPPELMDMLLAQGGMEDELGQTDRDLRLADQLRRDGAAQMQGRQVGRMYAPPTVANLAAQLMSAKAAGDKEQMAGYRREGIQNRIRAGNAKYLEALTGQRRSSPHMGDEGE